MNINTYKRFINLSTIKNLDSLRIYVYLSFVLVNKAQSFFNLRSLVITFLHGFLLLLNQFMHLTSCSKIKYSLLNVRNP